MFTLRTIFSILICLVFSFTASAQKSSKKSIVTQKIKFDTRDKGEEKSLKDWGVDGTWLNFYNPKASKRNAGDQITFVRIGFFLNEPYNEDGSLGKKQIELLDKSLDYVRQTGDNLPIKLSPNNLHKIIDWYKESDGSANVKRWYNVMEKTKEYVESKGHKVVALEVFNEPDWKKWNMGKMDDANKLNRMCKDWGVLRVGPSTLSTTPVLRWYKEQRSNIDAGGTHTLGGKMEEYIDIIKLSKRNGKKFMNPEVHSLVEVIVGIEAGMDSVCWWDQINRGRAAFMKACQGKRLAYKEVTENWSAACVYRGPDDVIYGFASTNERTNGKETKYEFICENQDMIYYLNGNEKNGQKIKKGEPFEIQAKIEEEGKKSITRWFKIVPAQGE